MTFFKNSRCTQEKISFLDIETYTGENDLLGRAYADLRGWLRPDFDYTFKMKCKNHYFKS
jgi:hypothetical protein